MRIRPINSNEILIISQCVEIIINEKAWQVYGINRSEADDILTSMPDKIYVAERDNIVYGFVTLRLQGMGNIGAYVRMLAVHEEWRGRSIGRALIASIQQAAKEQGDKNLFLICSTDNSNARFFYEHIGFEPVGILPDLVVAGHDEFLYRKIL